MYCYHLFHFYLCVITFAQPMLHRTITTTATANAVSWMKHDPMDPLNDQIKPRSSRDLINFFSDRHQPQYKSGDNSPIVGNARDAAMPVTSETWLQLVKQQSGRVVGGATDILTAPVQWLSHMRDYWPFYLGCMTIITIVITIFYCSCQHNLSNSILKKNFEPLALFSLLRLQEQEQQRQQSSVLPLPN